MSGSQGKHMGHEDECYREGSRHGDPSNKNQHCLWPGHLASIHGRPSELSTLLLKSFYHAADLPRVPYPATGCGRNSALVERHCDTVPRRRTAAPYIRDYGSQLRCPSVGARNSYLAPGLAGLGLPSFFHRFQGERKNPHKAG